MFKSLSRISIFYGFPGGLIVNSPLANAENTGLISGSGKSPGEGNGNPLQYLCLGNPMDRKAWQAPVHGVTKSRTVCTLGTSGKRDKGTITLSYSFKDSFESGR